MTENKKNKIKPDVVQRDYWRQKDVFADFFNSYLFGGEEKITTKDLTESDTDSSTVVSIDDTDTSIQGARDNLMVAMTQYGVKYAILGIEDFNHIHYATPFKIERYDVVTYEKQYKEITNKYRDTKELTGNELLSGIKKDDKFTPVITVVVYFGSEPWDGPTCLYDMLDIADELKPFVTNYKINLVEVRDNKIVFKNQKNKDLFALLKIIYDNKTDRKKKRQQLEQYSNNRTIDETVIKVVASTTNVGRDIFKKEDEVTVCALWDEVREEGREEGRAEGKIEGKVEGKAEGKKEGENKLATLINRLIADKRQDDISKATTDENIRQEMYKEYGITD